jgi:light-regulated signal transduction histidine kinase (bacteriophytochrome)
MDNLMSNAWKYTSSRQHARIEFGWNRQDDHRVYFIKDNGAGFDPASATRLFQPFQRLHSAVDFPGTGVGLATVQRIVSRNGGRIWAEAAVGQGATFYFTWHEHKGERTVTAAGL